MAGDREEEAVNTSEEPKEVDDKEEDTGAQIAPIVKLEEVAVSTGEENEEVTFDSKAKLYRFDKEGNQWKERGVGTVKLLKHQETGKVRLVMRQAKTLKICANHLVQPPMALQEHAGSDKTWVWHAPDFSDGELKEELFCIRLPSVEIAKKFKALFEEIVESQGKKSEEEEKSVDSAAELLENLKVEAKAEESKPETQEQEKEVDEEEKPAESAEAKKEA
uniref:RanBD1 domain-containing protein n=1 Tax=Araucaria cunninghamii TaxID=56994 RepID=A0A0D6QV95_ARACU